ncbi:MAG: hypothetical protein AB1644_13565 [Candidatus Zixiibacteriota bacterium]
MNKTRFSLIAVLFVILLVAASALFWTGCNRDINAPADNLALTSYLPGDPAEIAKVMGIQNRHTDALLAIDGVVGTGTSVDENGKPVIKVFTSGPIEASAGKVASSIEGVSVVIEETGAFTAHELTGRYRPVPIGVSVGNNLECAAGTIGCQVYIGGQKYILSNNHVLARENNAAIGEDIVQPGRYDNSPLCANYVTTDKVADLSDFEPLKFDGTNNYIDAAVALYSTTDVTCGTLASYYGYPGSTIVAPAVGLTVKKVGRTTELTTGTIASINVTVNVGYTTGTAKFVGQFMTTRKFDKAGDSGSLVVTNDTNNNPVGLLFAGTKTGQAICSPIGTVLTRFNATICTQ